MSLLKPARQRKAQNATRLEIRLQRNKDVSLHQSAKSEKLPFFERHHRLPRDSEVAIYVSLLPSNQRSRKNWVTRQLLLIFPDDRRTCGRCSPPKIDAFGTMWQPRTSNGIWPKRLLTVARGTFPTKDPKRIPRRPSVPCRPFCTLQRVVEVASKTRIRV